MSWFSSTGLLHAGDIRHGVLERSFLSLSLFEQNRCFMRLLPLDIATLESNPEPGWSAHQDRWVAELEQIISHMKQWPGKTCSATCSFTTSHHVTSCPTHACDWCCLCPFCSSHESWFKYVQVVPSLSRRCVCFCVNASTFVTWLCRRPALPQPPWTGATVVTICHCFIAEHWRSSEMTSKMIWEMWIDVDRGGSTWRLV